MHICTYVYFSHSQMATTKAGKDDFFLKLYLLMFLSYYVIWALTVCSGRSFIKNRAGLKGASLIHPKSQTNKQKMNKQINTFGRFRYVYLLTDLLVYFTCIIISFFIFLQFFLIYFHVYFSIIFVFPDLKILINFTDFSFKNK